MFDSRASCSGNHRTMTRFNLGEVPSRHRQRHLPQRWVLGMAAEKDSELYTDLFDIGLRVLAKAYRLYKRKTRASIPFSVILATIFSLVPVIAIPLK